MRPFRGLLPGIHKDPQLKEQMTVVDDGIKELYAAIGKLDKNQHVTAGNPGTVSLPGITDHGGLTGLLDDDHRQYALLAGRDGGQTLLGTPASSGSSYLTMQGAPNSGYDKLVIGPGISMYLPQPLTVWSANTGGHSTLSITAGNPDIFQFGLYDLLYTRTESFYGSIRTYTGSLSLAGKANNNFGLSVAHGTVPTDKPTVIIQGGSGQTGNLTSWRNSSSTELSYVDKDGKFVGDGSLLTNIPLASSGVTLTTNQTITGKKTFPSDGTNAPVFCAEFGVTPALVIRDSSAAPTLANLNIYSDGSDGDCILSSGNMLTDVNVADVSNKNFSTGNTIAGASTNVIVCNSGLGPIFQDAITTTKKMRFDLAGLAATTVTKKFIKGNGTFVEKVGTDLSLTGQTATITTTNLYASAPAAFYRATVYVVATASTIGTLTVTLGWTDDQQAQTATVITTGVIAAGGYATATLPMKTSGSNNITYATVVGGTALTYNLYIVLERMT